MGVWSRLRKGLRAPQRRAADLPTFEKLEPRILLAADPLDLAADDPYRDDSLTESAIVVDFGAVTSEVGSQITDHRSRIAGC